jgi:pimeloyl-ACP methyl ester carboxylesterase
MRRPWRRSAPDSEDLTKFRAKDDRGISRFRNDLAHRRFLTAYDTALTFWPSPPTQLDVATRYGTTHILASGSKSGTPIVLLHGMAVSSPSWFADIAALSQRHPVYAIDTITDAGRSIQTARIRNGAEMSLWLDDVLAALEVDTAHLVGLSYGGWLALNQARRSPDRLASITSVDPAGAIGRAKGTFLVEILPDSVLALAKSDTALHRLLRRLNNGTVPAQPLLELSVAGLRTFRARQPYPKRMTDQDLRSISTPALLLFCERSPVNRALPAARRSRQLIANAAAEIIPDAGHMLPVEKPELFTNRVLSFIHDIDIRHHTTLTRPDTDP